MAELARIAGIAKKDAEARQIMAPALEKVFIVGGTPVSYFKDIAKEVEAKMK